MSDSIVPIPKIPVTVRVATIEDLPFIDALQKKHSENVGFLKRAALVGKIASGHVLVAEEGSGVSNQVSGNAQDLSSLTPDSCPLAPVGYAIGEDRYNKREDCGIIYQLNVVPGNQRKFVGATLLKAMFDRAAYGCRLFCCWCAQDIEANHFWEAMGFVPLAFRAGGQRKVRALRQDSGRALRQDSGRACPERAGASRRVHIFWQKRIRGAEDVAAGWWFPSRTSGGSLGEDRLVFPIPPGTHWSDAKPMILPGEESGVRGQLSVETTTRPGTSQHSALRTQHSLPKRPAITRASGLQFVVVKDSAIEQVKEKKPRACPVFDPEAQTRRERSRRKNDPKLVAAARELRDRWLEHVNENPSLLASEGKYDVARALPDSVAGSARLRLAPATARLLPAA